MESIPFSGQPFLANPATFVFYPATILFVLFPLPWAFNLDIIFHIFIATWGTYNLVFLFTNSRHSGIISGIIYGLSGYFAMKISAGHISLIHAAALIPWVFYYFEKGYLEQKVKFFLLSGIILGLQILGGDPQISIYTSIYISVYAVIRHCFAPDELKIKPQKNILLFFLLIPLSSFGLAAIQIFPTSEFMFFSDRLEKSFETAAAYSFPPYNFFTFICPNTKSPLLYLTNETTAYFGIFPIVLSMIGLFFYRNRPIIIFFGLMLIFSITLILGHYTPLYKLYYNYLPFISSFRGPAKALVVFIFIISVLAGFGATELINNYTKKKQFFANIIIFILIIIVFIGTHVFNISAGSSEILYSILILIACSFIINIIPFIKTKHHILFLLIAGILFVDLYYINHPSIPELDHQKMTTKRGYETFFKEKLGYNRIVLPNIKLNGHSRGIKFHLFEINGYSPMVIFDYFKFLHSMADMPKPLYTGWLSSNFFKKDKAFSSKILGIKYAIIDVTGKGDFEIVQASQVMPKAVLVKDVIVLKNIENHIPLLKSNDFDPKRTAILTQKLTNHQLNAESDSKPIDHDEYAIINSYQPNKIELNVNSNSNAYLILSELYYTGWSAFVNEKEVPIIRADYLLRSIPITPGKHKVKFIYRPKSLLLGGIISFTTFFIFVISCLVMLYKKNQTDFLVRS